jgi:xanthine dehydrogenase/oxidase
MKSVSFHSQQNLWKKRGLSMIPMLYHHNQWGAMYHVHICVYRGDGTVAVNHGGIEMGQGINTKVAQVVAKQLSIPIESVRVKPSNNLVSANDSVTGASMGSDCACSVMKKLV